MGSVPTQSRLQLRRSVAFGSDARLLGAKAIGMRPSWIVLFFGALLAVLALQYAHGAYSAPIADYSDESAHVVTSLMYRQFLLAPSADPLQFAKDYYGRYPNVAAGHWPPVLHLSAAIWTIFVGVGKSQFIFYLALVGALTVALLYRAMLPIGSPLLAAVFVAFWMMLAQSQVALTRFMTEAPLALLTLAAVVAYSRYQRNPNYPWAILFGLLASAALLTKETAIALAFVPVLSVLATRRWELLRKGHFWLPAVLVLLIVAPWHYWVFVLGVGRFGHGGLLRRLELTSPSTTGHRLSLFVDLVGWPLLVLAVVGLIVRLAPLLKGRQISSPSWIAHGGLLAGGLFVHLMAPESEETRHLFQLSPSLLLFAAAGAWAAAQRLPTSIRAQSAALIGLCCAIAWPRPFEFHAESASEDVAAVARYLSADPHAGTVLISTAGRTHEGPLVAEVALLEPAPRLLLLRASKTIYSSGWDGLDFEPIVSSVAELSHFIDVSGVDTIVRLTRTVPPHRPDEEMLSTLIAESPEDWALAKSDVVGQYQIYRRTRPAAVPRQPIRIKMAAKLGQDLLVEPEADPAPTVPIGPPETR